MDVRRFDDLTRLLAAGTSRRALVKRALAGLVGGMTALTATRSIGAAASQPNGAACARATDCASRICKDGVCCNASCTGQCEACNLPGLAGTCSPVVGNPVGGRPACPGTGPCKGTCTGGNRQSCAFPGSAVSCGSGTCAGGFQTTYACGSNGSCVPTTTISCGLFLCNPARTACRASCASDADCVGEAHCAAGVCQGDQPLGELCTGPDQCQSGLCVDGVCCIEACTEQCEACNVAGNAGFCTPTPGAVCDDGDPCTTGDACGGVGNCEGTPTDCSALADQCNDGVCRPADGICVKQPKPNGTGCNDGNTCTQNDVCQNGACAGTQVVCTTPGVCETAPGTCNPQTGTCGYPDAPDDTSCGANRVCCGGTCCTSGQACVNGACQAGACLELQVSCDPADNQCCQEEATNCEPATFCSGEQTQCCRPTGGSCTVPCDCCGSRDCRAGRCCRFAGDSCASSLECCGLNCDNGRCCGVNGDPCTTGRDCCGGICLGSGCL